AMGDKATVTGGAYASLTSPANSRVRTWAHAILPYIEMDALYKQLPLSPKNAGDSAVYGVPVNDLSGTPVTMYMCPSDPRGVQVAPSGSGSASAAAQSYTDYAAVGGVDQYETTW